MSATIVTVPVSSHNPAQNAKQSPVLGVFGKGVTGSIALSFSVSAGESCFKGCLQLINGTCYAETLERRNDRQELLAKLQRHEKMGPARVCGLALLELQSLESRGISIPWFRFSTAGSVPMPGDADRLFVRQLRTLVQWLIQRDIPIHLPVESPDKTDFYRVALAGLAITVRESLQTAGAHTTAEGAVSWVSGSEITSGPNIRLRRVDVARREARERFNATGRKTIVCPAIVAGWKRRGGKRGVVKCEPIKCGQCRACEFSHIDIVYPLH